MRAKIWVTHDDVFDEGAEVKSTENVEVTTIVSAGILVSDNAGDEIHERLIPWHRVWEVWSTVEGEMYLASGR